MAPTFGVTHVLPLLPGFLARYPRVRPEWHFENRHADLIAEGYDAAIGGGFELAPGVVSRTLAPAHVVAVAAPAYLAGRVPPADPAGLAHFAGIVMRSPQSGRVRRWTMRDAAGTEKPAALPESAPEARLYPRWHPKRPRRRGTRQPPAGRLRCSRQK